MSTFGKFIVYSLILSIFILAAPIAFAQSSASEQAKRNFYATQPPLEAKEIPYALDMIKASQEDPNFMERNLEDYSKKNGYSVERSLYVLTKVSTGMIIAIDPALRAEALEQVQYEEALPTDAELALIKDHLGEIMSAMNPN
jgi:hypothetical protein